MNIRCRPRSNSLWSGGVSPLRFSVTKYGVAVEGITGILSAAPSTHRPISTVRHRRASQKGILACPSEADSSCPRITDTANSSSISICDAHIALVSRSPAAASRGCAKRPPIKDAQEPLLAEMRHAARTIYIKIGRKRSEWRSRFEDIPDHYNPDRCGEDHSDSPRLLGGPVIVAANNPVAVDGICARPARKPKPNRVVNEAIPAQSAQVWNGGRAALPSPTE